MFIEINAKLSILFAVLCEPKCGAGIIRGLMIIHQRNQTCDNPGLFWDQLYHPPLDYIHDKKSLQNTVSGFVRFDAPSLQAFKARLDVALGSLGCWLETLHIAGVGTG